jgi:hypothetical protein
MRMPEAEHAYVPEAKLSGYLLATGHPVGQAKARFFRGLGFDESNVAVLEQALIAIAQNEEVQTSETSPHGTKYVVRGSLAAPNGRTVVIDTIWIIENGQQYPRLVTAYPA